MKDKYKAAGFPTLRDGEWALFDSDYHACCDCGLVHKVAFKVTNGKLYLRFDRNQEKTQKLRQYMVRLGDLGLAKKQHNKKVK
jgi:hypothetical protein